MTQGFGVRGALPSAPERKPWEARYEAAARKAARRKRDTFGPPKADPAPFGRLGRIGWLASALGLLGGSALVAWLISVSRAWHGAGSLQGAGEVFAGGVLRSDWILALVAGNLWPAIGIGLILAAALTIQFARRLCDAGKRFDLALALHLGTLVAALGLGCLPYGVFLAALVTVVLYLWALLLNPVEPA